MGEDPILKSNSQYGYNDGSSLGGSTFGGGDSQSPENSRDDWESEY